MNPALHAEPNPPVVGHPLTNAKPYTVVLQPDGNLDSTNCQRFQQLLETALEQVTHGVIIDFLWLNFIDNHGVISLVKGLEQAAALGKFISFQSMNSRTCSAIEAEWKRQRTALHGSWSDRFEADLEQFLDGLGRN